MNCDIKLTHITVPSCPARHADTFVVVKLVYAPYIIHARVTGALVDVFVAEVAHPTVATLAGERVEEVLTGGAIFTGEALALIKICQGIQKIKKGSTLA